MPRNFNNGLGVAILVAIMAVTPLIPAAVSSPPPQWVWDADGRVTDATGQFVRVETPQSPPPPILYPELHADGGGNEGGGGPK